MMMSMAFSSVTEVKDFGFWGMFQGADWLVQAVMLLLLLASVATWTIFLAKQWQLRTRRRQLQQAAQLLSQQPQLAVAGRVALEAGLAGQMLAAAEEELRLSAGLAGHEGIKERVASRLERLELAHERQLRSGIGILASIGAVAPFVGLLGTVWGIMNSFIGIAKANTTHLAVVAPGIAEALLATAMGLAAAIPAVLIYNHFSRRLLQLRGLGGDLSALVQQIVSRQLDGRRER